MSDSLSERDQVTLSVLANIGRTTVAEQRRQAIRDYARRARQDEDVAGIVRLILAARRERDSGGGNVINLRGNRGPLPVRQRCGGPGQATR